MPAMAKSTTEKPQAKAAITGLGFSAMSRQPIGSVRELAASAILAAIADAGLRVKDIDGLLLNKSPTAHTEELPLRMQNDIGLRDLSLLAALDSEGSTAVQMVQYATLTVAAGLAKAVVCVFSDTPIKEKARAEATLSRWPCPCPASRAGRRGRAFWAQPRAMRSRRAGTWRCTAPRRSSSAPMRSPAANGQR